MNLLPVALRGTAFTAVTALAFAAPAAVAYAAAPAAAPHAAARPAVVVHAGAPVVQGTAPAVRPALPAPKLQGPLQSTACVNAVCDLWARAGTTTVASRALPIWGFSSSADPSVPVTTPGPVLVVNEGDTVTINVHNGLSNQNLSLAIPAMTGLVPDTNGVATGGVKPYTFKAGRPGTYLYEAGHTADGGRQAAMGLVGALVVKAAPDANGRPTAYGTAGTGYDDEAVMVLTEIDPALNTSADPFAFDMRSYAPKYRLINGKAFPETDPIATDVNRTALLRYVNAGLLAHPMTTLGVDQEVVGQDSRPTISQEPAVTVPLAPGKTADTLVTMPKDQDGRRFMVFESGGQLNNNGDRVPAAAGVSPQQAFGGMMTYLDTNPTVVSGDHVGPVATRVVASPNPASALADITVTADFTDAQTGGSNIDRAEVVIDDLSIGVGNGIPFAVPPAGAPTVTGVTATIKPADLQTLKQGRHTLWVRAHDTADNWGVVNSTTVNLTVTGAATTGLAVTPNPTAGQTDLAVSATGNDSAVGGTVTAAEYFIDVDQAAPPVNGTGTQLTLNQTGAMVVAETGTIPAAVAAGLAEGKHTVSVHTQDSQGLWGPMAPVDLVVDRTGPTLNQGEILPGLVTSSTTGSPSDAGFMRINATFTDPVSPPTAGVNTSIAAVEGFLDTAGANGTGIAFQSLDGTFNSATESTYGLVPLTEFTQLADGPHQIQVHAQDAAGNWGPLTALTFTLDRNGPDVSALSGLLNTTGGVDLTANAADAGSAVAAAEWFDNADPGVGKGKPMTVTLTPGTNPPTYALSATATGLATGDHIIAVRAKDANGNWGKAVTTSVTVNQALMIFANTFNAGNANVWSQRVGTVKVAAATAFGNSPALTVAGRTATYVVDNRPTAESNLHAQFGFAAGAYTTKGTVVDVFQARTSTGTSVLTVQYQSTATGISQLRVGVQTKTGWKYSNWSTIPKTAVTVKVNWTAATSGTATLAVEGATVGTATGNTSAYRIESDALGVVAANGSGAVAGAAAIDNFTSNR